MNLSGWRLLLFAVVGLVTIAILSFQGGSKHEELETVDRHTGLSPSELIEIARRSGSAVAALEFLSEHEERFSRNADGRHALALLRAEVVPDEELTRAVVDAHPHAAALREERRAARDERLRLAATGVSPHDPRPGGGAELARWLRGLQADQSVRAACEDFFAAASQPTLLDPSFGAAPDGRALAFTAARRNGAADPSADETFAIANAFRSEGRTRARMRWLLDGYAEHPDEPVARNTLTAAYLDHNLFAEARAVLDQALADGADDTAFWRLNARLGALSSDLDREAHALSVVIGREQHVEDLRRLIDLYRYLGRPGDAVVAADRLAELSNDPKDLELPVFLALEGGYVDRALQRLTANAATSDNPRFWRERIVAYALEDMRVERALEELVALDRDYPDAGFDDDLESLYRRLGRTEDMATLERRRFAAAPADADRAEELVALYLALDRRDEALAVLDEHMHALAAPVPFFKELAAFKGAELPGTDELAVRWSRSEALVAADLPVVVDAIRPWLRERTYREMIADLADRFDEAPLSRGVHLELIASLFAAGELEEATRRLNRHVGAPDTTIAERMQAAELLFGSSRYEPALEHYAAVLSADPRNAHALMRVGQILVWTGDSAEAVTVLEHCRKAQPEDPVLVEAMYAEALWSAGRRTASRVPFETALDGLRKRTPHSYEERVWLARIHARLGHVARADQLYEGLLEGRPNDVDLLLDHVEFLTNAGLLGKARRSMDRAVALEPRNQRGLRVGAALAMREERYEEALIAMNEARELANGPDPGIEAEMGHALKLTGEWRESVEAYQRAYELAPNNREIGHALRDSRDDLASLVAGQGRYFAIGDDEAIELTLAASTMFIGETTRLSAALTHGSYEGITIAAGDVEEDVLIGDMSVTWSASNDTALSGGVRGYFGAPGSDAGGWGAWEHTSAGAFRRIAARAYVDDLLTNPMGAVALEGRATGAEVETQIDFSTRMWMGLGAHYRDLEVLDPVLGETVDDGQVMATAVFGWRVRGSQAAVIDGFRVDRGAFFPQSPYLIGTPEDDDGALINAWIAYLGIRLLGDEAVADVIPIGESFDYATLGASIEDRLTEHLGGRLDGFVGTDVGESDSIWGIAGSLTWRPTFGTELFLRSSFGQALGRSVDDSDLSEVVLGFYLRCGERRGRRKPPRPASPPPPRAVPQASGSVRCCRPRRGA